MENVLLLSKNYEPISIIGWQKAIRMLALEKVEVVETTNNEIKSPSQSIKLPSILRLIYPFKKRRAIIKFNKQNLFARDNFKCQYCKKSFKFGQLTYDHVIPRSRGGKTNWTNIVTACQACNGKKGSRTPEEAGMALRAAPRPPSWIPLFSVMLSKRPNIPNSWKYFCYA